MGRPCRGNRGAFRTPKLGEIPPEGGRPGIGLGGGAGRGEPAAGPGGAGREPAEGLRGTVPGGSGAWEVLKGKEQGPNYV